MMRKIIVLILCLVSIGAMGQRRYAADGRKERDLSSARGFTSKDVDNKTDAFLGLHASLYKGARQYLGFSVEGGWSTFLNNTPVASVTPGGWTAGGKLLYEYHFGLLFLQTGLGVGFQRVTTPVNNDYIRDEWRTFYNGESFTDEQKLLWDNGVPPHPMEDPLDGAHFTLIHQFSNRSDISELYYAQLPLNVGYYIVGTYGIGYVAVGAQVQYAFYGRTIMNGPGTSEALFNVDPGHHYIGEFGEMDNHGFRKDATMKYVDNKPLPIKLGSVAGLDVLGHIEGGYEFNTFQKIRQYRVKRADKLDCRLRFSGYMDISLGNIYPDGVNEVYEVEPGKFQNNWANFYDSNLTPFTMTHIYGTKVPAEINRAQAPSPDKVKDLWLRNLSVGVRFTVLFSLQAQEHCILCDPWRH